MTVLLIAYGNPMRGDDGAGLALAERIEQIWRSQNVSVRSIETHQLTPELAADMAEADVSAVVFVDACAAEEGEPLTPTIRPLSRAVDVNPAIGHHLQPRTAAGLRCRTLRQNPTLLDDHHPRRRFRRRGFD